MTTRTPYDPAAAAALFAAGAIDAPAARIAAPMASFAFDTTRSDDQIRVAVLPGTGWPEEYRETPVRKPVPGRVYH